MEHKSTINPTPAKSPNVRVVIIGAVAGGAAAAARLTRLNNKLNITLIDRSPHVSIASCGMPYYIGREIEEYDSLLVHTPETLQKMIGITRVLVNTEAIKIDRKRKIVVTRRSYSSCTADAGATDASATVDDTLVEHPYDFLIISTGASPIIPPIEGYSIPYRCDRNDESKEGSGNKKKNKVDLNSTNNNSNNNRQGAINKTSSTFVPDVAISRRVVTLRNLADMNKIAHVVGQGNKPDLENNQDLKKLIESSSSSSSTTSNPSKPSSSKTSSPQLSVAVVGAGFIGLEIAEQIHALGHKVTILERNPTVLPACDDEIGAMLHPIIRSQKNVTLITNDSLVKISSKKEEKDTSTTTTSTATPPLTLNTAKGITLDADLVVLCVGVKAESKLARDCGLRLSTTNPAVQNQLITVDNYMRTSDPSIYAVGDVVELSDGVFRDIKTWTPLATVAAMEARIAADHIVLGKSIPFRGTFSTAIVRCFGTAVATTGWSEKRLKANKTPFAVSVINGWSTASYYPNARPVLIKMTYCPTTGRLFGGQCVGSAFAGGVDKRIDVIATALLGNLTIHELSHGQFAYAPPFNSAKDPVTVACLNGRNISFDHLAHGATRLDPSATIVDVRPKGAFEKDPVTTATKDQARKHLFWATSKEGAKSLVSHQYHQGSSNTTASSSSPATAGNEKLQSICFWGRTSYFAHRNILQAGVPQSRVTTLQGGNVYAKALKEAELSGSKL